MYRLTKPSPSCDRAGVVENAIAQRPSSYFLPTTQLLFLARQPITHHHLKQKWNNTMAISGASHSATGDHQPPSEKLYCPLQDI